MKPSYISLLVAITSVHALPALSQLILPNVVREDSSIKKQSQAPIMNNPSIVLPPLEDNPGSDPSGDLIISDVIGKERSINIFAGFTRDIDPISRRLDDGTQNTTVLAPLNSEIQKLPRKPWEDSRDYGALGAGAYEGQDGEDRAHQNLKRFVEAHVIPMSPWIEGEKVQTIGGDTVWWESSGDNKIIYPGKIEVSSIASRVSNGEVWIIKAVMNHHS